MTERPASGTPRPAGGGARPRQVLDSDSITMLFQPVYDLITMALVGCMSALR